MFFEIIEICTEVKELYDRTEGELNQPSLVSLDNFKRIVIRAYTYIGKGPILPEIYLDGEGGLKILWDIDDEEEVLYLYWNRIEFLLLRLSVSGVILSHCTVLYR